MRPTVFMAVLCLLSFSTAQATELDTGITPPDIIMFDDSFSPANVTLKLDTTPPQVCFPGNSVCIAVQANPPPPAGDCSLVPTVQRLGYNSGLQVARSIKRSHYPALEKILLWASKLDDGHPTAYYQICNYSGLATRPEEERKFQTSGVLCFGRKNGDTLLACTFIKEDRTHRTAFSQQADTQ